MRIRERPSFSRVRGGLTLFLVALMATAVLGACADGGEPSPWREVGWTVDPEPLLELREGDPRRPFPVQYMMWAARLPDGGVVVLDSHAPALHFFDVDGAFVESVGRRGEGPGELLFPRWAGRCGTDSLFVWDYNRRVVLVTDSRGQLLREFRPEGRPHELRCVEDGGFVVRDLPSTVPGSTRLDLGAPGLFWLADGEGRKVRDVTWTAYGENRVLGRMTRMTSAGHLLVVGTADSARVDLVTLEGKAVGSLPLGDPEGRPGPESFERAVDLALAMVRSEGAREAQREFHLELGPPEGTPPYRELLSDEEGVVWAVISPLGAPDTRLEAVDLSGAVRARVRIPFPFTPYEVGADYLLGERLGAHDAQSLVLLRLRREG